ncbi:MAG: TonB family protein [Ignavibacteria bacterium]|nr:TonB family protein [Ignavibacteria bacterium]
MELLKNIVNHELADKTDICEIIFFRKNREYGAYKLRKAYKKYLSVAMWIAILFVILATTGPTIYRMINPEEETSLKTGKVVITELAPPPSIGEQKEEEILEAPPPLKSTIKFTPPVVKPDEQVKDEYIPTVDELKDVDPGLKTEEGVETGIDYSLIEEEVEEKIVKPKKEEAQYFIAVEEMPSPIGGITAIQKRIKYPEIARRAGVEGTVYILAYLNEEGIVVKTEIVKGIGGGCDEEAEKAVKETRFTPGKQRGKPVKVKVMIPVKFQLQDEVSLNK